MPRRYKKHRKKYRSRIPRQLITNRFARTFKYCETLTFNPGAGTAAINSFSANGMFDPNITGTGHQPVGFDELVGIMYSHYTVIAARITCHYSTDGTSGSTAANRVGISIRDVDGYAGTGTLLIEQGRTRWGTVAPVGSNNQKIIKNSCNIGRFLGRTNVMSDPELKGTVSTNPTEQAYFIVWVAGIDDTNDAGAVYVTTEIDYIAILTEPKLLASS